MQPSSSLSLCKETMSRYTKEILADVVYLVPKTDQEPPGRLAEEGLGAIYLDNAEQEPGAYFIAHDIFAKYLGMTSFRGKLSVIPATQKVKMRVVQGRVPMVCVSARALERMLWTVKNPEKRALIEYLNRNYNADIACDKSAAKKRRRTPGVRIVKDKPTEPCDTCDALVCRLSEVLAREREWKRRCELLTQMVEQLRQTSALCTENDIHSGEVTSDDLQ